MLIGYSCVFSWDNSTLLDVQYNALLRNGVHKDKIVTDHLRNRLNTKPQLEFCLQTIKAGDTFVVWRLERLGNFRQQYEVLKKLKAKSANFHVLSGFHMNDDGASIFDAFFSLAEQIGFRNEE